MSRQHTPQTCGANKVSSCGQHVGNILRTIPQQSGNVMLLAAVVRHVGSCPPTEGSNTKDHTSNYGRNTAASAPANEITSRGYTLMGTDEYNAEKYKGSCKKAFCQYGADEYVD